MADVVVVGGGVMGSAAAWQLARRGVDVTLLEQFEPGHDHGSSHGSSRIFRLAYADPFYVGLAVESLALWRQLEAETGRTVLTLTGALDHGPEAATDPLHAALTAAGQRSERLDPAAAQERFPGLRFDVSVLFHPDAGRVHADDAVAALQAAAVAAGAEVRSQVRVSAVIPTAAGVEVRLADGGRVRAKTAVVAVGGWAPSLLADLPGLPPMRVTQEQPAHFPPLDPVVPWPSFIHHAGAALPGGGRFTEGVYGLGSVDGVKAGFHGIGPVVDPDHRDRSFDPDIVSAVQEYAAAWLPGVDSTRPEPLTCLYTLTPDHDFVVDRVGDIVALAGFSGHGFKFAPRIGALAADLALAGGRGPARFALGRSFGPAPAVGSIT